MCAQIVRRIDVHASGLADRRAGAHSGQGVFRGLNKSVIRVWVDSNYCSALGCPRHD